MVYGGNNHGCGYSYVEVLCIDAESYTMHVIRTKSAAARLDMVLASISIILTRLTAFRSQQEHGVTR